MRPNSKSSRRAKKLFLRSLIMLSDIHTADGQQEGRQNDQPEVYPIHANVEVDVEAGSSDPGPRQSRK